MKVAIVAHHSRAAQAWALAEEFGATVFMDEASQGVTWNHHRALHWAAEQSERVIVMEDDALPVQGFLSAAEAWCKRFPRDLLSFYLGAGRPPQHQPKIKAELARADSDGRDWICLDGLFHGVAYSIPGPDIRDVLVRVNRRAPADMGIGAAWKNLRRAGVVYTVPSLVDHADGPSIAAHPDGEPRTEKRRALRLAEAV